ncbi:hypothetical protein V6N12_010175 [Hibiscus sabdariffa]|uniref:Uncharacterized protein n=1 Tax=Hibiscus sabdariffa TaxID=183260 RepID=A0ABR2EEN4_9ROSI
MIGLWAYSNNLPLALRPITHVSNTECLSVTILLLLCQRLLQRINNVVIRVYLSYSHISSDEMETLKYVFGSSMRSRFLCLRNGSIVFTTEFYIIQYARDNP